MRGGDHTPLRPAWLGPFGDCMFRALPIILTLILVSFHASAQVQSFPTGFKAEKIATNGTKIHMRRGGKTQGQNIGQILDALKVEKADLVTHDIGNMVGYAFAAQYADRV